MLCTVSMSQLTPIVFTCGLASSCALPCFLWLLFLSTSCIAKLLGALEGSLDLESLPLRCTSVCLGLKLFLSLLLAAYKSSPLRCSMRELILLDFDSSADSSRFSVLLGESLAC